MTGTLELLHNVHCYYFHRFTFPCTNMPTCGSSLWTQASYRYIHSHGCVAAIYEIERYVLRWSFCFFLFNTSGWTYTSPQIEVKAVGNRGIEIYEANQCIPSSLWPLATLQQVLGFPHGAKGSIYQGIRDVHIPSYVGHL